ncbi:SET domain-containing protein [Ramaria rubella]|nr:SET domain-containing protein [Ramaria rubella]
MDVKPKMGGDSPPPLKRDTTSTPSTPTPRPSGPQLIGHLPRAEDAAMKTFSKLSDNAYQYKTLGRSRQAEESLTCDCSYEPGIDARYVACGDGSDCINRLTQVECEEDDCRCRSHCLNQRFQRKQYAQFHIVLTEMKGFGLRAAADIPKDAFIYEYIGEVVSHPSFVKRMRDYADEGIRHFYFMMLQKDEFIDATKKGGIGRFANHSCNPNCYVAKWTVGKKVRMGIFSKRNIKKDEELTFNYNVDRYGHDAQPCYCGEAKCVGFIGGKTQTDIAAMDDLVLDALGMTEDVELLGLKGTKKKRGKKLGEDFEPVLKPLTEKDVPQVIKAIRQTSNRKLLVKLLARVKCTADDLALRMCMRFRGFGLMTSILEDNISDIEICTIVLESLSTWPLMNRNKVEDSKIETFLQIFLEGDNEKLKNLAEHLMKKWATLEVAYRIPKRGSRADENGIEDHPISLLEPEIDEHRPAKRIRFGEQDVETPTLDIKPLGRTDRPASSSSSKHVHTASVTLTEARPTKPTKQDLAAIIAAATAAAATPAKPVSTASNGTTDASKKSKPSKDSHKSKANNKEKRLLKLVGAVVVKCMSKYQSQMEYDDFKKHAKQLTHLITEKEKKSSSFATAKLDEFSDEKKEKIKKFVKDYVAKVLRRLKDKKGKSKNQSHDVKPRNSGAPVTGNSKGTTSLNGHDNVEDLAALNVDDDLPSMDVDEGDGELFSIEDEDAVIGEDEAEEDPWEPDRESPAISASDAT